MKPLHYINGKHFNDCLIDVLRKPPKNCIECPISYVFWYFNRCKRDYIKEFYCKSVLDNYDHIVTKDSSVCLPETFLRMLLEEL